MDSNELLSDKIYSKSPILILVLVQLIITYLLFTTSNPVVITLIIMAGLFVPFIVYNPQYLFLTLLIYISILPSQTWGERYEMFPIFVNKFVIISLLFIVFAVFLFRNGFEKKWSTEFTSLDLLVGLFLCYTFVNMLWGLNNNNNNYHAYIDFYYIFLYVIYFFIRFVFNNKIWINRLLYSIVIASTIAALEYIVLTVTNLDFQSIFITRVTTQQPHLAQIAIPILLGSFLFLKNTWLRIGASIILIPNFLMVLFSQQRGLWVGIIFSLAILLMFYYLRDGISMQRIMKFVGVSMLVLGIIVLVLIFLDRYFHLSVILTVYQRVNSMGNLSADTSLHIRLAEIKQALEQWKLHPFIGEGLGATFERVYIFRGNAGVDNSYAFILWKLGIVGLFLFLAIYLIYISQIILRYWKLKTTWEKFVFASLGAGMLGMLVIALTNQSIIKYRFDLLWATILGITQNMVLRNDHN